MTYEDVMRALAAAGLTEEEAKFSNIGVALKDRSRGRYFNLLQKENVLRERGWGFLWDERWWEYTRPGKDVVIHNLSNFWTIEQPPWKEMVIDLREVTGWVNGHDLLPVVE